MGITGPTSRYASPCRWGVSRTLNLSQRNLTLSRPRPTLHSLYSHCSPWIKYAYKWFCWILRELLHGYHWRKLPPCWHSLPTRILLTTNSRLHFILSHPVCFAVWHTKGNLALFCPSLLGAWLYDAWYHKGWRKKKKNHNEINNFFSFYEWAVGDLEELNSF